MHREGLTKVGIWHLGVRNMLIWRQPFVEPGAGQTFVSGHATIAVQMMPPSGWALRAPTSCGEARSVFCRLGMEHTRHLSADPLGAIV